MSDNLILLIEIRLKLIDIKINLINYGCVLFMYSGIVWYNLYSFVIKYCYYKRKYCKLKFGDVLRERWCFLFVMLYIVKEVLNRNSEIR